MNAYIRQMLPDGRAQSPEAQINRLREMMQQLALLALWRAKFFEVAAFYGGTALRILYGLDRFSEDLDFSLLTPDASFNFEPYAKAIEREFESFGFAIQVVPKEKRAVTAVESVFLKANTMHQLLVIETPADLLAGIHPQAQLKIKLEADTNPPGQFDTDLQYIFLPVPFAVRSFSLPCLFAGKMHALLCRGWKLRVKGRDWYDFVWYTSHHPRLHLRHLEARMRQSGHYTDAAPLTGEVVLQMLHDRMHAVDLNRAADEVGPFLQNREAVSLWSPSFFWAAAQRIQFV